MSNDLITSNKPNYLLPQTFEQAERYAEKIANSSLCPNAFKNKPGDVLIALQMGAEVGLSPMQAIQNIAVINGRPSLWGDAVLGVVKAHPYCQSVKEWMDGTVESGNAVAYCEILRKGQAAEVRAFSIADAKRAGLWGKAGPWTQYPARMLQMRARGFCARDTFPDALRGLHVAEEAQDIIDVTPIIDAKETIRNQKALEGTPISQTHAMDSDLLGAHLDDIKNAPDKKTLQDRYRLAKEEAKSDKIASNKISIATKERLDFLKQIPEKQEVVEEKPDNKEWLDSYDKEETK